METMATAMATTRAMTMAKGGGGATKRVPMRVAREMTTAKKWATVTEARMIVMATNEGKGS